MPSIEQFREFLTLAEYLNFSAAAESLFITQSALSRHIAALERELGSKLFERSTQSVQLTQAGAIFKEQISPIVDSYDEACARLRILKAGYSSRIRISYPLYATHDYLGSVPEMFEQKYPNIKLEYNIGDPNTVMQNLLDGKTDLAIMARYSLPSNGKLEFRELFTERLGVLMSRDNPLARRHELSMGDLQGQTFLSIDNIYFRTAWRHTLSLCKKAGFTPNAPALINQMEALMMAVRRGDGISVVGQHMRNQQSALIAFRPLTGEDCVRQVCMWYRPDNPNGAIEKFIKFYLATKFDRE